MQEEPRHYGPYPGEQFPAPPPPPPAPKHSGLGIASFVMGAATVLVLFGLIAGAVAARLQAHGVQNRNWTMALGLGILFCFLLNVAGLTLGLVGVFQKGKRRVFAGVGIFLNILPGLAIAALLLAGTMLRKH